MFEHGVRRRTLIEHEMFAHHAARVRETVGKAAARGVEEQARRLRAVRGQDDRPGLLEVFALVAVEIVHPGGASARVGRHAIHIALRAHLAASRRLSLRNHGEQRRGLRPRLAAETHAESAVHASRAAAKRLRRNRHGRRKRMQPQLSCTALEQHARRFHRQRRHGIGLGARRIERTRIGKPRHPDLPLHLGVVRLELLVGNRPVSEPGAGDGAQETSLFEVDLVKAPEVRRVVDAAAADQARIQRRLRTLWGFRSDAGIRAEGLRA